MVSALTTARFKSVHVGDDCLIPASVPASRSGKAARFKLPGTEATPVQVLNYRQESGMGRILDAVRATSPLGAHLKPAFTSHLAKLLVTMVQAGRGMAWLPQSLIADQLASGELVRAGGQEWEIPIEIHVFRPRSRLTQAAEAFWTHVHEHPASSLRKAPRARRS